MKSERINSLNSKQWSQSSKWSTKRQSCKTYWNSRAEFFPFNFFFLFLFVCFFFFFFIKTLKYSNSRLFFAPSFSRKFGTSNQNPRRWPSKSRRVKNKSAGGKTRGKKNALQWNRVQSDNALFLSRRRHYYLSRGSYSLAPACVASVLSSLFFPSLKVFPSLPFPRRASLDHRLPRYRYTRCLEFA